MSHRCYKSGCKELPVVTCNCSNSLYICEGHIPLHIMSYGEHIVKKFYTRTLDTEKNKIIDFLIEQKHQVEQKIFKAKYFSNQLINHISNESTKLLKNLNSDKVHLDNQLKLFISQSLLDSELLDNIKLFNFKPSEEYESNIMTIQKQIRKIFDLNLWFSRSKPDDFAIIFSSNLSNFVDLVDLISLKKVKIDLKINDLTQYCFCCKIEPYKYFVYGGGASNPRLSTAKIIDIKNLSSKALTDGNHLSHAGGCFYKNEVYVFGGFDGSRSLANCQKFNLKSNVWTKIIHMPEINHGTNASVLKGKILVSGYQSSNVYIYESDQNQFSLCKYTLPANANKYFIENWIVCFGSFLYEIDEDDNLVIRQAFLHCGDWLNSSAYFKRGNLFYFVITDVGLYRINSDLKTIELVKVS